MIKKFSFLALVFLGVLLLPPPRAASQTPEKLTEEFHQTYALSPTGRISLENIQGAVRILAWDRNEVKVDAVKSAYSRELLNEAQIKVDSTPDSFRILTKYPDRNLTFDVSEYRRYKNPATVEYTLTVPRNARLSSIELVNGNLDIDGVAGDVNASCVNGKLTARNLKGEVKLGTVNGKLEATFNSLNHSKAISLGSVNGGVHVFIPSDSNATVKATTVHGGINNDFGLPVRQGDYVGRELYGQIGRGGARIKLGNVNGTVNIRRASDGRQLSPSTSLLNAGEGTGKGEGLGKGEGTGKGKGTTKQKDNSDYTWDGDWDSDEQDTAREARRVARDAQREAVRAQREAQRAQVEARRAQLEAERAVAAAKREVDRLAAREGKLESAQAAREAQREAAQVQREAALAQREDQREAVEAARAAQAESSRAVQDAAREVERVAREIARTTATKVDRAVRVFSDGNYRLVERDTSKFDVSDNPRVMVETFDGTVAIHGWDKSEVVVNVVKRAGDEQGMRGIRFNATKDGNQIKIAASFDKAFAQRVAPGVTIFNANANLEIFVPRKVILRVTSGDGYLALNGINGEVDLITDDGSIDVVEGKGRVLAKTGDGRIRISKFDGAAEAVTGDGRISLEGRFVQLSARTGDGSIVLVLPANFDAIIETDAESVVNESNFALTEEPATSKRVRRWKVGKGGTVLHLRTGNGRILLRRASLL